MHSSRMMNASKCIIFMCYASHLCLVSGFQHMPRFFSSIPKVKIGTSVAGDVKNLKKQQENINQTLVRLTNLVNHKLSEDMMDESKSSKEDFTIKTVEDLRVDVKQALEKVAGVESHTTKEISAMKSKMGKVIKNLLWLNKQMKKQQTELKTKKTSSTDQTEGETKTKFDADVSGKTSDNVQKKQDTEGESDDSNTVKSCPTSKGYHQLTSKLCIRVSDADSQMSWYDGSLDCGRDGGQLISFSSKTDQEAVTAYLKKTVQTGSNTVLWVGKWKKKFMGNFAWLSKSYFLGTWAKNQPSGMFGFNCVGLATTGLHDDSCRTKHRYVCNIKVGR